MALGGGTFTTQNKVLPGSYINFVSVRNASATLSDRGTATMPLTLDWGVSGEVFEVNNEDFQKNSLKIFGYSYTDDKLKHLRDLFTGASTAYFYRLNGDGAKAKCDIATAKYAGTRGNDIRIVVAKNADDEASFDVTTYMGNTKVDAQTVKTAAELADNDFVTFADDAELSESAGMPLSGGTNSDVTGDCYQKYLDLIESYQYNVMGAAVSDAATKKLLAAFCKRMRDEIGAKFQLVLQGCAADYMGVINVKNTCKDDETALVYWVTGMQAGCAVNRSLQNKTYNGEFTPNVNFTQKELAEAIQNGEFVLHKVNNDIRVLEDINSMVTVTEEQGDVFKDNQTVRVIDQIANDIAVLFNSKYLGVVPNDNAGRTSLWSDIVKHHEQLREIRAIEDFSSDDITIAQGNEKKSVVVSDMVTVVNAMGKLYMTVTVA